MQFNLQKISKILTSINPIDFIISRAFPHNPSFENEQGLARAALSGLLLGLIAGPCPFLVIWYPSLWRLWSGIFAYCVYHCSEFFTTASGHPRDVSTESFLFYHSEAYSLVRIGFMCEFVIWQVLLPSFRASQIMFWIGIIGIIGTVFGQGLRTAAMYHAGKSFTHVVATYQAPEHTLVTTGIYRYFRHPSYFGWGLWAISIQLVLGNPLSAGVSAYMAYRFFSDRIPFEEQALIKFFGKEYEEYRQRTPTWIPFIQ